MKKLFLALSVALLPTLSLADQSPSEFLIGVDYGLTDAPQAWSEYGRMGLELAREELNASGGINGRPIKLIYEDSKNNPAQSVSAFKKLVTFDHVPVVIGNVWSHITNPLIPLAKQQNILLVSPTVMDTAAENPNDHFFTMGHTVESLRAPVELFFKKNSDVKKIAILCWDDAWGKGFLKIWREVAQSNGIVITKEICHTNYASDFRSEFTNIASDKPDAVMVAYGVDRVTMRMKEQHISAKILSTADVVEAVKTRGAKGLLEGEYFTNWQPSEEFAKSFYAKYQQAPILEAYNHYEALRSIAKAAEKNPSDPRAAFKTIKYQGVAGPIDFTQGFSGNHAGALLFKVENGEFIEVR